MHAVREESAPLLPTGVASRRSSLRFAAVAGGAAALVALLLSLFVLSVSWREHKSTAVSADARQSVSMLVLGDWGREAQYGQTAVADALAHAVHEERKRSQNVVIVSTGDNFYKHGVGSIDDRQFNTSFEDVYDHEQLATVPWYVSLGNHDHLGSIDAQMHYSQLSSRWNMPSPYYTKQLSPKLMAIFLDTTPFVGAHYGRIARQVNLQSPKAQLMWLSTTLRSLPSDMYFVLVGHHNMYTMSIGDHLGTPELRDAIEPLLRPYTQRMLAYISGHEHSLMHLQPKTAQGVSIDHIVSGAGSKLHRIERPPLAEESHWSSCCDVLPLRREGAQIPHEGRTVWGRAAHGFFSLRFDGHSFEVEAISAQGERLYSYHKRARQ